MNTALIPLDMPRVPEPIAEANRALHEAVAMATAAHDRANAAWAEAQAAPDVDTRAAVAAVEANQEPPAPTATKLSANARQLQRAYEAAQQVVKERHLALNRAVNAHHGDYVAACVAELEDASGPVREALETFIDTLPALIEAQARLRAGLVNNGHLSHGVEAGSHVARRVDRALDSRRATLAHNPDAAVSSTDPVHLLAALALRLRADDAELVAAAREATTEPVGGAR